MLGSDSLPLRALGGVDDLDALCLELVADAVGLGPVLRLACGLTGGNLRLDLSGLVVLGGILAEGDAEHVAQLKDTCLLRNLYAAQEATVRPYMEQWTGSKLGKEYVKAAYCHPAYLPYMQSTSCEM